MRRVKDGRRYTVLPGGGVEDGEVPAEAAVRELEEETGLRGVVVEHLEVLDHDDRRAHYVRLRWPRVIPCSAARKRRRRRRTISTTRSGCRLRTSLASPWFPPRRERSWPGPTAAATWRSAPRPSPTARHQRRRATLLAWTHQDARSPRRSTPTSSARPTSSCRSPSHACPASRSTSTSR
ncbi:NUDIX domain-containing protein [Brachybacterium huguangmaarense]|uniref:NUDIX domain-containing protein n=1 Tax=Brachybacterium huguangmaarense TaxID=1652028 RepID=UPI0029650CC2|nr:NUDIX domain-containing protein [Brachybacterium huguangmaarense]